jgi:SAM-dependent methyltransferase
MPAFPDEKRPATFGVAASDATSPEKRFYEQHYQRVSRLYAAETPESRMAQMKTPGDRYFCVADMLPNARELSAVEWGFGDIARSVALSRFFGRYHALDIAADMMTDDRALPFTFSEIDLNRRLPIDDETYDVALAMMVIEHLFDPFHSFREITRITRKGGYVMMNLPLVSSIKNRLRILCGDLPVTSSTDWWLNEQWDGGHLHYFTIPYIRKLGSKCGLELQRFYAVGRGLWLKNIMPNLFCIEGSFVFRR